MERHGAVWVVLAMLAGGCDEPGANGVGGAAAGGEAAGGETAEGGSSFGGSGSGGEPSDGGAGQGGELSAGGAGGESSTFGGLEHLGSLVVLGDSIGDGGGQGPYYYDRLRNQLAARYGTIEYRRKAQSGSKTSALAGQIDDLPSSLPGPVAVAITSGGNDMKAALPLIIAGADQAARDTMGGHIANALDALLEPGRFGAGVEVYVFEANIYDASDGAGDFGQNGCAFGQGVPPIPTDGFFANWNGVIEAQVVARGQIAMDMHGYFYGHGYHASPSWYAADCTHPNAAGHAELANFFYEAITGQSAP